MAKRRTKSQKKKTAVRRASGQLPKLVYRLEGSVLSELNDGNEKTAKKKVNDSPVALLDYDPVLLKKDLMKTLALTVLMFVLIGISYVAIGRM